MSWISSDSFRAESGRRFLRLGFPIRAAKAFRGGEIPFGGFGILTGGFEIACQLKRNHGVTGFFVQTRKLPDGVLAGAGPTNPGGDLFPVSHVLACIVAAEARYSQRRLAILGKRFFGPGDDSLLTAGEAVRILAGSPLGDLHGALAGDYCCHLDIWLT